MQSGHQVVVDRVVHYPRRSLYKYVPFVAFDAAVIERTATE